MYDQVKALKEGKSVDKPIYNHVTGVFDPAEKIESPDILILEGLHPFADERVRVRRVRHVQSASFAVRLHLVSYDDSLACTHPARSEYILKFEATNF